MSKYQALLCATLLWLLIPLTGQILVAQDAEPFAPRIIDINPFPGAEIGLEQPLIITFDQPMAPSSVVLSFEPSLTGSLSWLDEQNVTFRPDGGTWTLDQTYDLRLTGAGTNGLPLEMPFHTVVQTQHSLVVMSVTPRADEQIGAETPITINFDRPIVPLMSTEQQNTLPSPLSIEPEIEGHGEWIGSTVYRFTPDAQALAEGTRYTATIPAGLTALDGAVLTQSYTWSFRTREPSVETIGWQNDLVSPIHVRFSHPMDHATTEQAFSMVDSLHDVPVKGTFQWDDQNLTLSFQPLVRLLPATLYRVRVETSAHSQRGHAPLLVAKEQDLRSVARPTVIKVAPEGELLLWKDKEATVALDFNNLMDPDSFEGRYLITPKPKGKVSMQVSDSYGGRKGVRFTFMHEVGTTYTITLLPGFRDEYGTIAEKPFSFSYHVRKPTPEDGGSISFLTNSNFLELGAYQEKPMLGVSVSGTVQVKLDFYDVDLPMLTGLNYTWQRFFGRNFGSDLYYNDNPDTKDVRETRDLPWRDPQRLLHSVNQTLQVEGADERLLPLMQADGTPFPLGLYGIEITENANGHGAFVMAVTNAAITLKAAPGETVAWVTDYITSKPLVDVPVSVYVGPELRFTGRTDAQGLAHIPKDAMAGDQTVYVVAEDEAVFGIWQNRPTGTISAYTSYFYTDRPAYRPGETVHFRGIVRDHDDTTFTLPTLRTMTITASNWDRTYTATTEVAVSEMGTFTGSLTLPSDIVATYGGDISLSAVENRCDSEDELCDRGYSAYTGFQVAEFRVPEFEMTLAAPDTLLVAGDPLAVTLKANFYDGAPLSNAEVEWHLSSNWRTVFHYEGPEKDFRFQPAAQETWVSLTDSTAAPATTDVYGEANLGGTLSVSGFYPTRGTLYATITDESNQRIAAKTEIVVHPSHVYIGLRAQKTFTTSDEPVVVDLLTVTPESQIRPNQTVELTLVEDRLIRRLNSNKGYDFVREDIILKTISVQTDMEGKTLYTFLPPRPGLYRVEARAFDEQGHEARSMIYVYSLTKQKTTDGFDPYSYENPEGCEAMELEWVKMAADRDSYRPGDTAEIVIFNPLNTPVIALLTVERQGVLMEDVIEMGSGTYTYDLPITGDYAPNVYFNIAILRAIDETHPDPAYLRGRLPLTVEPVDRLLNVVITPSAETVAPGDDLTIDVMVTDWEGKPVQADVGIAVTDDAALALRPRVEGSMINTFYPYQYQRVSTSSAISALLATRELQGEGCGGGGGGVGGEGAPPLRDNFVYTPLWTSIMTDETGHGSVSVTLPHNLTRWRIEARAVTADADIGEAQTTVTASLPFSVHAAAPRFAVVGDHLPLSAVLHNDTEEEIEINVQLVVTGVTLDDPRAWSRYITLAPRSRQRVDWWGTVNDTDAIHMTMRASYNYTSDVVRPAPIPVLHYVAPDYVGTSGVLNEGGTRTEGISLPPDIHAEGLLTVQMNSSLASTVLDALPTLDGTASQNMEAIASHLYASSVIYRTLKAAEHLTPEQETLLSAQIEQSIKLLYEGRNDYYGPGWGWWRSSYYSEKVTAYVLLALYEAHQAGFETDDTIAQIALKELSYATGSIAEDAPAERLNEQAFFLYVRYLYSTEAQDLEELEEQALYEETSSLDTMFTERHRLSDVGRAYLLLAYDEFTPEAAEVKTLISDLASAAVLSVSGTHWEAEASDWEYWGSDTRTTAVVLTALLHTAPDEPGLANAVRWLVSMRRGTGWRTTQDTAWSTIALMDWIKAADELNGQYDYTLTLNNLTLLTGEVTSEDPTSKAAYIDVTALHADEINRLTTTRSSGEGALYYTANLQLQLPVAALTAQNRGVIVERAYFLGGPRDMVTSAKTGDVINVRLSITASQNIHYFRLIDVLPAGLEIINPTLQTSPSNLNELMPEDDKDNLFWSLKASVFDWIALQDEGAAIYTTYLPRGTYVYTYQVEAITPGEFQLLPASGQAIYQPDIFGRTAGGTFTITDEDVDTSSPS